MPDALAVSARDVVLPVVPMFHINAWGLPYSAPMVGAKVVFPGAALDGKSPSKDGTRCHRRRQTLLQTYGLR
jgi:acyl-CoA synthetase (AMP-forming)/AMP-acid ligase II